MVANHPYLEFAQRHASTGLSTLNAFAAISRVHNLLYEATERQISKDAPSDFPNLLNEELLPVDELELIDRKILNLEFEITEALCERRRTSPDSEPNLEDWTKNLAASRSSQQTEFDFIEGAEFIPRRHFNFGRTLQIALRQKRLEYLTLLRAEL